MTPSLWNYRPTHTLNKKVSHLHSRNARYFFMTYSLKLIKDLQKRSEHLMLFWSHPCRNYLSSGKMELNNHVRFFVFLDSLTCSKTPPLYFKNNIILLLKFITIILTGEKTSSFWLEAVVCCSSTWSSWKFRKFYRTTPVLESLFNKAAGTKALKYWNTAYET